MIKDASQRISESPKFKELVRRRTALATRLSIAMLTIYFGFILLVAYAPGFLGAPIGAGVMTIGVPIGLGVIVSAFVLTGVYVWRANTTYDQMNAEILEDIL